MREDDATIRIASPPAAARRGAPRSAPAAARPRPRRSWPLLLALGAILAGATAGAWFLAAPGPPGAPAEPPPKAEAPAASPQLARSLALAPPAQPLPPPAAFRLASEDFIRGHRATAPTVFRLAEHPRVFVLDFPDLDWQGAAMNRIAALIEKAGQPRDRLLPDIELAAAIARSGDTPATYYYGHNYRGRDLERFFALAERDAVALNAAEMWLRDQLSRMREAVPTGEDFAVISIPGLEPRIDAAMRAAILHHEIGHGIFFTRPDFAAHVARIWREVFTEAERAGFRRFLEGEGYDPANEEIMMNEAMAYLIFTPDPRFFSPAMAGLAEGRAEELRAALRAGLGR
jgi:hypothetical protein